MTSTSTPNRTRRRLLLGGGAVVALAVVAWLAFGYFGVHTLFLDDEVDEAGPVFESGAGAGATASDTTGEAEPGDEPETGADPDAGTDPDAEADDTTTEAGTDDDTDGGDEPAVAPTTTAAEMEVVTLVRGEFEARSHPGEGVALVLNDGTEQRFLRFEDFATDNGPDLDVYLSAAPPDAPEGEFDDDFVNLGDLKGNIGDQNYEIPPDVDLDRYRTVVVWCVRFGVAFTVAELA